MQIYDIEEQDIDQYELDNSETKTILEKIIQDANNSFKRLINDGHIFFINNSLISELVETINKYNMVNT